VLDYRTPGGAKLDSKPIILGGPPPCPRDLFPAYCCNCLIATDELCMALYDVKVPMCRACARRWNSIRWTLVALPCAVVLAVLWWAFIFGFPLQRPTALVWATLIAGSIGIPIGMGAVLFFVVSWIVFPVRVMSYRHDPRLYLTFRNRDYQRITRQWMAGGRTTAANPDGFPVPPKHLKK
jgi:hypothetical protein